MGAYRVLLVDDEEEIRQGICRKMNWEALGFVLAGEAANGMEALEGAERHQNAVYGRFGAGSAAAPYDARCEACLFFRF